MSIAAVDKGVRDLEITFTIKGFAFTIGGAEVAVFEDGTVRVNGIPATLSKAEHAMLLVLAQARGQIRTPRMLLNMLWRGKKEPDVKILDVYMSHLRTKLGKVHPDARNAVRSVWGRGYSFGEPATAPITPPADLPPYDTHWVIARKAIVIEALRSGAVTLKDILGFYPDLSALEFTEWCNAYNRYGPYGLRATKAQLYEIAA